MTSERTSNFGLPLYTANDITSWLVDFNGAMNEIDKAMQGVKTIADKAGTDATGAAGSVTEINQTLVNIQNSLANINNQINSGWTVGSLTAGAGVIRFSERIIYRPAIKLAIAYFNFAAENDIPSNSVVVTGLQGVRDGLVLGFRGDTDNFVHVASLRITNGTITNVGLIPANNTINYNGAFALN